MEKNFWWSDSLKIREGVEKELVRLEECLIYLFVLGGTIDQSEILYK